MGRIVIGGLLILAVLLGVRQFSQMQKDGEGLATESSAAVAPELVSFISHARRERLRARVQVPADDPTIPSLYAIFPGSDYLEREVFDLMGIVFEGHPDLSRILMPETWQGHPLRKDYAVGAIPVQFKAPAAG